MPSSAHSATTQIYTFPYTTLFRSPGVRVSSTKPPSPTKRTAPLAADRRRCTSPSWRRTPGCCPPSWTRSWPVITSTRWRCGKSTSRDRKSTRLNSSHVEISYAVFCSLCHHPDLHFSLHDALPISRRESIVNKTPVSYETNRSIGGRSPALYLAKLEKDTGLLPAELDTILAGHHIDAVALRKVDFERSEEHTSELQSRRDLVCRLLLTLPPPRSTLFPTRRSSDLPA